VGRPTMPAPWCSCAAPCLAARFWPQPCGVLLSSPGSPSVPRAGLPFFQPRFLPSLVPRGEARPPFRAATSAGAPQTSSSAARPPARGIDTPVIGALQRHVRAAAAEGRLGRLLTPILFGLCCRVVQHARGVLNCTLLACNFTCFGRVTPCTPRTLERLHQCSQKPKPNVTSAQRVALSLALQTSLQKKTGHVSILGSPGCSLWVGLFCGRHECPTKNLGGWPIAISLFVCHTPS